MHENYANSREINQTTKNSRLGNREGKQGHKKETCPSWARTLNLAKNTEITQNKQINSKNHKLMQMSAKAISKYANNRNQLTNRWTQPKFCK